MICLFIVVAIGCGKGFVGMSGRVTYSDTGEPLEKGTVAFTDGSILARGDIGKDGRYVIGSLAAGDGLPPGTYQVFIAGAVNALEETPLSAPELPKPGERGPAGRGSMPPVAPTLIPLIDQKYTTPQTSGLTLEVTSKTRTFDFTVDRAKTK